MGKRVVVAGYYGYGNVGDEAILCALLKDLREAVADVELLILSANPEATTAASRVNSIPWNDWPAVIHALEESDLLIVGGGGLLNSYLEYEEDEFLTNSQLFSVFIFGLPTLAYLLGKPCMIYGVGASHINSESAKEHIRMGIGLSTLCTVRDPGSKAILESIGCDGAHITVTADPAFRLINVDEQRIEEILKIESIPSIRPKIGIILRNWDFGIEPERWEATVAQAIQEFSMEREALTLFIPFQKNIDTPRDLSNDLSVIARVRSLMDKRLPSFVLQGDYSPEEISSIIANCDLILGMRLHSCILSIKNAVPFIGLAYDPKVANILAMAGLNDFAIDLASIYADKLALALETIYQDRERIRAHLVQVGESYKKRALENARMAAQLLKTPIVSRHKTQEDTIEFIKRLCFKQTKLLAGQVKKEQMLQSQTSAYYRALRNLIENEKFEAALIFLEQLQPEEMNNEEWNYLTAYCLQALNKDLARAVHYYDLALDQGFDEFWVRYNRGALHATMGDIDKAKADLLSAAKLKPDHAGVRQVLQELTLTGAE